MKKQVKTSTSGQKRSLKTKQKPARVKKDGRSKTGKITVPKRKPSTKVTRKKKVIRKRKIVKKTAGRKGIKKDEEKLPEDVKWLEDDPHDEILSRFIFDPKGSQVGETIGVEGKQLILKDHEKFYSIPLNSIKERNDELILVKKVDWNKAEKKGEKWRKKALDVIKPKK
jgi:hypothetical protein